MEKVKVVVTMVMMLTCVQGYAMTGVSRVGRYSTVKNKATPSQINPLVAVGQYKFPAKVQTVGGAMEMILQGTGYRIVPKEKQSEEIRQTLTKPLPFTIRELGPLPIKEALVVVMGERVFTLVDDPLHRLVNFEVKPEIKKILGMRHVKK